MPLPMHGKQSAVPATSNIKNTIAVAAGKGGVGKSTVTVNTALALKSLGFSVGIMDADLYGPSIRKMLPEDCLPLQKNGKLAPAYCNGIPMISMSYFHDEDSAMAIRAPIANKIIAQFIQDVDWGELDYLLIDFPPGTGDIHLTLAQKAHLSGAVMVTTPQEIASMDVRKAINLFDQVKVPIIGIVENMSYYLHPSTGEVLHLFGSGGGERLAFQTGVPFLGRLPIDPDVSLAGDRGYALIEKFPNSPSSAAFLALASQIHVHLEGVRTQENEALRSFEILWKEVT